MIIISLPITKEQFEKATLKFIEEYKRLPYLYGDDVIVEITNDDDETELKPYRANKYINEYYKNQDNMTKEFLETEILTYKLISESIGLSEVIVKNAIAKETKNPTMEVRRGLDIFFNKDYYEELGKYATLCSKCTKKCKQDYYVQVRCRNYKEKK